MAKPNYQYEKRQRELAKKAKKAEKAARKAAAGKPGEGGFAPADDVAPAPEETAVRTGGDAAGPAGPGTEAAGRD